MLLISRCFWTSGAFKRERSLIFSEKGNCFPDTAKFLQSRKDFRLLYQDDSTNLIIGEKVLVFPSVRTPHGKVMLPNEVAKFAERFGIYVVLRYEYIVLIT
jgi:hypothetical protein